MADYKDIIGTAVRNNAGNLPSTQKKELFFDTTNLDFKYQFAAVTSAGVFRTGGNLNQAKSQVGSAGTYTQALCFGGKTDASNTTTANTEQYNGVSWTEVNNLNTSRRIGIGTGGYTSALYIGGYITSTQSLNESWNGTCWTEVNDLNTARHALGGCGPSTSNALAFWRI